MYFHMGTFHYTWFISAMCICFILTKKNRYCDFTCASRTIFHATIFYHVNTEAPSKSHGKTNIDLTRQGK
jgi:hypothetical protein